MNYQIFFPREILQDKTINNQQKNLLIYMYLWADVDHICRKNVTQISNDLNIKVPNIPKLIHGIKSKNKNNEIVYLGGLDKYIEVIKETFDQRKKQYKLKIIPKRDFDQLDSVIYKQFKKDANLIVEYFKFQVTYKLVRVLRSECKIENMDRFTHAKIAKIEYSEFCKIEEMLVENGLLSAQDYYISFTKQQDYEKEIKEFIYNSKNKENE